MHKYLTATSRWKCSTWAWKCETAGAAAAGQHFSALLYDSKAISFTLQITVQLSIALQLYTQYNKVHKAVYGWALSGPIYTPGSNVTQGTLITPERDKYWPMWGVIVYF